MGPTEDGAPAVDEVLARLLPPTAVRSVTPLGRGTDHVAVLVDGDLVARRSLDPDPVARAAAARREVDLLAIVAEVSTLPVPEVVAADLDAGLVVTRRLPGVALLDTSVRDPRRLAAPLGRFLDRLHATPPARVAHLVERDAEPLATFRDEAVGHARAVTAVIPPADRPAVEAFLAADLPPEPTALVFCHHDLGAEHLLVDPAASTLTGVLDWSDAALTDPARDLGRLHRDLGPALLGEVLAGYGRAWSDDDAARTAFHARCALLEDLAFGLDTGDRRYVDAALASLRRTFGAPA